MNCEFCNDLGYRQFGAGPRITCRDCPPPSTVLCRTEAPIVELGPLKAVARPVRFSDRLPPEDIETVTLVSLTGEILAASWTRDRGTTWAQEYAKWPHLNTPRVMWVPVT